ncbi:hypothetical protein DFH29DRAFT_883311 [Suillus ampliporus]|nr:hypothetical protein DFH29DRAFT_883311 [Suillus ampliporus]
MVDKLHWRKHYGAALTAWWASKHQRTSPDISDSENEENVHIHVADVCIASTCEACNSDIAASSVMDNMKLTNAGEPFFPLSKPHYKVTSEDTEDEDDLIAIQGVCWKEKDQTKFLEEIGTDSPSDASHKTNSTNHDDIISDGGLGDKETDAESDCDDGNHGVGDNNHRDYSFELRKPPTAEEARKALGYKDMKISPVLKERLDYMRSFLWLFTDVGSNGKAHFANSEGGDLKLHLQSVGKFIQAQDLIDYLNVSENQTCYGMEKGISLKTAQWRMRWLGYHWRKEPKGQYSDRHECDDIIHYCQNWMDENISAKVQDLEESLSSTGCQIVIWFHDELTFYTNNWRKQHWVHISEGATPLPKDHGPSMDNGKDSACILFKAGKAWDSYFTNENILTHTEKTMNILSRDYPDEDHVLVFNNTTIHLK